MGGRGASMRRGEMRKRKGEEELLEWGTPHDVRCFRGCGLLLSHGQHQPHVEREFVRYSGDPPVRLAGQRGVPESPFSRGAWSGDDEEVRTWKAVNMGESGA